MKDRTLLDALVRAKEDIAAMHDMYCRETGNGECSDPFAGYDGAAIRRIDAAINEATGGNGGGSSGSGRDPASS